MGFVLRWLFAFILLAATYNPTGWDYVHWARGNIATDLPLALLFGLLLFVAYVIYLRATIRSIGAFGMALALAILGTAVWVLVDHGLLRADRPDVQVWIAITVMSLVLGIGLSWSHVRRALTGQSDVDDLDD